MNEPVSARDIHLRLWPLLLWCAVIFAFSQMPGSGRAIEPTAWYIVERKSAHVVEYAILTLLAYRFFRSVYSREALARIAALAAVFALAYGALDELHQAFVFGRGARLTDVMIDSVGILLVLVTLLILRQRRGR
ncbi:MAG: VanZ family protein [Candidatus Moraniibacteriota bacterium]|nr:MAG: VanZ family protein [Candidatus Moranbacteria bacterium]